MGMLGLLEAGGVSRRDWPIAALVDLHQFVQLGDLWCNG